MTENPRQADAESLAAKLQQFRSELSPNEQEIFDSMTAAAVGDPDAEVQGFLFQQFFKPFVQRTPKTKDYGFSSDTIEGDLVKPEGTDLNVT